MQSNSEAPRGSPVCAGRNLANHEGTALEHLELPMDKRHRGRFVCMT